RARAAAFVRDFQPQALCQVLDRLREGHPVVLHQKPQYGAVRPAAEAVVELLLRAHPEGRCLLAVEGAAGLLPPASLLQGYPQANDLDDVRASDQLVDEALRDA